MTHKSIPCILSLTLLALICCMIPATSWARGGPPDPAALIAKFDQDGDGKLSAEEFKGPADHFTRMDTDGDGYLTAEELEAGKPGPPGGGGFEKDDANNDGKVSKDEFSGPADLFDRLDADGDGYITREEATPPKGKGGPGPREESE